MRGVRKRTQRRNERRRPAALRGDRARSAAEPSSVRCGEQARRRARRRRRGAPAGGGGGAGGGAGARRAAGVGAGTGTGVRAVLRQVGRRRAELPVRRAAAAATRSGTRRRRPGAAPARTRRQACIPEHRAEPARPAQRGPAGCRHARAGRRRERHLDGLLRVVHAQLARARLVFEPLALVELEVRLADVLDETVGAGIVERRLVVLLIAEDEVAIEKLLPLLHLALEDRAEIVLIADDVRRQDEKQVRLPLVALRAAEKKAEHRNVAEDRDLLLAWS